MTLSKMNKATWKRIASSLRGNGAAYTLNVMRQNDDFYLHVDDTRELVRIAARQDWLAIRAKWLANPGSDTRSSLLRLSSTIGAHVRLPLP